MDASKLIGYDGYFATKLRDLMKKAKVTQQDLAAAVGTTRQDISQYADGSVQPNIEKLYKIANFFNVSADYLLGLSDNPNPDINTREISRLTGLTEHSIERLEHETKWICEFGKSNNPQEALKYWNKQNLGRTQYPCFQVINLLLADSPVNLNYPPIINVLEEILAFKMEPKNVDYNKEVVYGLFKSSKGLADIADIENNEGIFDTENLPSYFLGHNDILELLMLKLQETIKRYKDEHDEDDVDEDDE